MKARDFDPNHPHPSSPSGPTHEQTLMEERTGTWDNPHERRMRRLINRLIDTDGVKLDDDQHPALEASLTIRGIMQPLSGALSITPEGTLKLMVPVPGKAGDKPTMMEVFFDYADVTTIALERKMEPSFGSSIIQPS